MVNEGNPKNASGCVGAPKAFNPHKPQTPIHNFTVTLNSSKSKQISQFFTTHLMSLYEGLMFRWGMVKVDDVDYVKGCDVCLLGSQLITQLLILTS